MATAPRSRVIGLGVAVLSLLPLASTHAADPVVHVKAPEVAGTMPRAWPSKLRARLVEGLAAGGVSATTDDAARAPDAATAERSPPRLGASLSITATGRDYALELTLTNLDEGDDVTTLTRVCDTCGFAELGDSVEALATAAVRALAKAQPLPATVKVSSEPSGASVTVDGAQVGTTPLELPLSAGEHTLAFTADGHVSHRRRLVVAAGELLSLDASLSPAVSNADVAAQQRRRIGLAVGGATMAGGITSIATGVALLLVHGRPVLSDCAGGDVDSDGDCRFLRNTRAGGGVALGIGVAAVAAGATVVGLTVKRSGTGRRAQVRPHGLGLEARF